MSTPPTGVRRLGRVRDEAGASAVEYALLLAGITAIIVVVVMLFGSTVRDSFHRSCSVVDTQGTSNDSGNC